MRKFLFLCAAFVACAFVGCDKPNTDAEGTGDGTGDAVEYKLVITPSTITIGEEFTMTVEGEGAEDMQWQICYENSADGTSVCLFPGASVQKISTAERKMTAGKYTFHAAVLNTSIHTPDAYATLVE